MSGGLFAGWCALWAGWCLCNALSCALNGRWGLCALNLFCAVLQAFLWRGA